MVDIISVRVIISVITNILEFYPPPKVFVEHLFHIPGGQINVQETVLILRSSFVDGKQVFLTCQTANFLQEAF